MGVPIQRVNMIVKGKKSVTAETAILLARVFGTTADFWMDLQVACDLYDARAKLRLQAACGLYVRSKSK